MRLVRSVFAIPRARLALLAILPALLTGCSSKTLVPPPATPLSALALTVHLDTLAVGGQFQFVAVAYDTSGAVTGRATISWRSTDAAVCSVSRTGLVTATGEGSARVIASSGGKADSANVYVKSARAGWYAQDSGTTSNLDAVCFLPDGHTGFAVGATGTMVMTTDAGATWSPRASSTVNELTSVWFTGAATGWAVGKGGVLLASVNGGLNWAQRTNLPTAANLECIRFADAAHGWIAGGTSGGFVARTHDGGASWTTASFGSGPFYGVAFADTLNGWLVGAGEIYGTHDGGASWYLVQPTLTAQTLRAVARVSNTQAWAVGALGSIVTSTATADSLAWALGSAGSNYSLNAIHMTNASTGWIAGSNLATGAILATTDGGGTWTPQVSASATALKGIYFADGLRGWAVGVSGRIVHTSTAGLP